MSGEPMDLAAMRAGAASLSDGYLLVFEPVVKRLLAEMGLRVPRGVVVDRPEELSARLPDLATPLVVKAFGPGILHKTDLGAVRLGVEPTDLAEVAGEMAARLALEIGESGGLLIEEQLDAGTEVLVGWVRRGGLPIVICGLGGVLAEGANTVVMRIAPISADEASSMVEEIFGSTPLGGPRAPIDAEELAELLLAIAGPSGVASVLAEIGVAEFECNPVIVTRSGPVVADARLLLEGELVRNDEPSPARDFGPLFHPESIALVGVSTSGKGLGSLSLEAYRRAGWRENLYVVHPSASSFGEVPAVRSLAEIPGGGVDYLKVTLPAPAAVEFLTTAAAHARVIQVISDDFSARSDSGQSLAERLLEVARSAKVPVVGPNCIGSYCPSGRQTYELAMPEASGMVGIVSQSGGMSTDLIRVGAAHGLRFSKVCSVGNGVDVSPAEMLEYLATDEETGVIGAYLEGISDPARLVRALRAAASRVPVVLLVSGSTASGAAAATSHSGALATDKRVLAALGLSTGVTVVSTMDELLAGLVGFQQYGGNPPQQLPQAVLVAGHGGGHTVVVGDACEAAGLFLPALRAEVVEALERHPLGVQKSLVNPIELPVGPIHPPETLRAVLETICERQRFSDVVLHFTARSFYSEDYFGHGTGDIVPLVARLQSLRDPLPGAPRVFAVARSTEVIPDGDRRLLLEAASASGIPCYLRLEDAVVAVRALQGFDRARAALR